MEKIKLKDYKGECVCYIDEFEDIHIVATDDAEYIKELSSQGITFYGTTKEKVFEYSFIEDIKDEFIDYANDNGYEDMSERLDFESKEFKEVEKAVKSFIDSLEDANNIYYQDKNVLIEVSND